MTCIANNFNMDAIMAESAKNDFRPAEDEAVDEAAASKGVSMASDEAESRLKQMEEEAAKAQALLAEMEAGLNDDEEAFAKQEEEWVAAAVSPDAGISMTDALVGKSLFDKKEENDDGEENLEHGKIEVEDFKPKPKENKSAWELCCGEEKSTQEKKDSIEEGGVTFFDWARERGDSFADKKKKKKKSIRRTSSHPAKAASDSEKAESKKTKKRNKSVRRTKSTD